MVGIFRIDLYRKLQILLQRFSFHTNLIRETRETKLLSKNNIVQKKLSLNQNQKMLNEANPNILPGKIKMF